MNQAIDEIVRERECKRITGLSRSTRWRLERAGQFPQRRPISPGCVGWLLSEIDDWVATRAAAAGQRYEKSRNRQHIDEEGVKAIA